MLIIFASDKQARTSPKKNFCFCEMFESTMVLILLSNEFINSVSFNELNCNNNTILIFPGGPYHRSGKEAANTLNSLSDIIPGDWDNVTVAGVSAGGGSAFSLARNYSVAEDGTYKYHISTLSLGDSYHPERDTYGIPNSDDDYLAMINKDMKLVGVTSDGSHGNPDAVRVFRHWASLGGETFYIEFAADHNPKCAKPYENNYLHWILGKGELTEEFKDMLHHTLKHLQHVFLLYKRHFAVDLSKLWLTVSTQVFVAEALCNLEISVEACHHKQLLKQLW